MRIAIWQTDSVAGDVAGTLAKLPPTLQAAAAAGADLLLCPELWLSGYNIAEHVRKAAEAADGPSARRLAAMATAAGVAIAYGYPEHDGSGALFNSMQLIGKDGRTLGRYRKTHLYGDAERQLFTPGDRLSPPVEVDGRQVAMLICYDVEFPETVRALAQAGAELILVPTAVGLDGGLVPNYLVPARAIESQLHIAYANRCGTEGDLTYCGLSCLTGPLGKIAMAGSGEALLIADLDDAARRKAESHVPYWRDRRPELYGGHF